MRTTKQSNDYQSLNILFSINVANAPINLSRRCSKQNQYMQRGGAWDQSDVKGAKKKKWLASDKEYSGGGFKKEQSVSIFGYGAGLDWTGSQGRQGSESVPGAPAKFKRGYKAPNVNTMKGLPKKDVAKKPRQGSGDNSKKFFGLF